MTNHYGPSLSDRGFGPDDAPEPQFVLKAKAEDAVTRFVVEYDDTDEVGEVGEVEEVEGGWKVIGEEAVHPRLSGALWRCVAAHHNDADERKERERALEEEAAKVEEVEP